MFIQTEATPNPATLKFLPGRDVLVGEPRDFRSIESPGNSPLAQGLLTDKYLQGVPADSRAAKEHSFLKKEQITAQKLDTIRKLNTMARERGQSLAQMAIAWLLKDPRITSVLIGASKPAQVDDAVNAVANTLFDQPELDAIENILKS